MNQKTKLKHGDHGVYSTYAGGCRCDSCRLAWREYRREHRRRTAEETNERVRRIYAQNRAEAISILGGECVLCGSEEDLQFDHIIPSTKEAEMVTLWHRSKNVWLAEVAKCQLLCEPCHREKTFGE